MSAPLVEEGTYRPLPFEAAQDVGRSVVSPVSGPILAEWMTGRGGFQHQPDPTVPVPARNMSQGFYTSIWSTTFLV